MAFALNLIIVCVLQITFKVKLTKPVQTGIGLFHFPCIQVFIRLPINSKPLLHMNLAILPRDLIFTHPFLSAFLIKGHRTRPSERENYETLDCKRSMKE